MTLRINRAFGSLTTLTTARRLASLLAGLALEVLAGLALALGALRLLLALLGPAQPARVLAPVPTPPVQLLRRPTLGSLSSQSGLRPSYQEALAHLSGFRVLELRHRARAVLGSGALIEGRRIAQATRQPLLAALAAEMAGAA